jgi:filamentous hemagglutinin family protein
MRHSKPMRRHVLRPKMIALSVAACFGLAGAHSLANPTGGSVASGSASFASSGNSLTVTNSANAIINWQSFSIGVNEITQFLQSSSSSAVLNRVVGAGGVIPQSVINGILSSNGRVFLLNSSGVVIGAGARIDVAGFVASSLNLSNEDFLNGKMSFTALPGAGGVSNAGVITTPSGGRVFLIAPDVQNSGAITAPQGQIVLAAGKSVDLVSESSPFVTVRVTADTEQALNLGKLIADSGRIDMSGALVRQSGVAQANSAVVGANGEIRLVATQNVTLDAGSVTSASGGAQGGSVQVSAPVVSQTGDIHADGAAGGNVQIDASNFLQAGTLSASGSAGPGGTIAVTAPHVIQTASAVTAADGSGGNGGSITVDASGATDGLLFSSASYSATGDKGGNITLLGHDILLLGASADTSGASGGGTILVGGDLHGANPAVANASTTGVNFSTTLKADATQNGDGGKIVVWSDNNTQYYGTASARGGAQSGNGGSMEISGRDSLTMGGFADAGAANGTPGSVLLDPKNIIIDSNAGGTSTLGSFQLLDPNPVAGNGFGTDVVVLSNQNVVVTAPNDNFGATGAGAVFLYNSSTGSLISALTGSSVNDHIGNAVTSPITTLPSGNFVVTSPQWNGNVGAATFVNGTLGLTGAVSAANSLVGSTAGDNVGQRVIDVLPNGNYIVSTPNWSNAGQTAAGAVTFVNGTNGNIAGTTSPGGTISATNSLVGTQLNDQVGNTSLVTLNNGNYLVTSSNWANGTTAAKAGAVTLVNGTNGNIVATGAPGGAVSPANSLVGTTANDQVGSGDFVTSALSNGNYVVLSPNWNGGMGAVTFGNGTTGITGNVSAGNSLVGSTPGTTTGDQIGSFGVMELSTGNYLVFSPNWNNGAATRAGAVTFVNGTNGNIGPTTSPGGAVSAANSLIGTSANDQVGQQFAVEVGSGSNINYIVQSQTWTNIANGMINAGAVTFGSGTTGVSGTITSTNSLIGTSAQDLVGSSVVTLANGNYVVISSNWTNPGTQAAAAGAVTFGTGANGVVGTINATNSLIGSTPNDQVGSGFVTQLSNSNYVVSSPNWSQPAGIPAVGAVTWVNGTSGNIFSTTGPGGTITAANSLVGVSANDRVGSGSIAQLTNGNYVVLSPSWTNSQTTPAPSAGAVTFAPATGAAGTVTPTNSLVGTLPNDQVGSNFVAELANGNYVVKSPQWNGGLGAATFVNGANGDIANTTSAGGSVSATNSLVGSTAGDNIGLSVTTLSNNNYVVSSTTWTNLAAGSAGSATFVNGTNGNIAGTTSPGGAVSAANSLVGTSANDLVGTFIVSLSNGNYVVESSSWNGGAGAATFVNGTNGNIAGTGSAGGSVSAANSLVGTNPGDQVGQIVIPISSTGNYVVISQNWNGGRGAVTFENGTITGAVSSSNSLVGSTPDTTTTGDRVGSGAIEPLSGGNYLVLSPNWNNVGAVGAGAVTWVNGTNGNAFGQSSPGAVVSATNSLVGTTAGDRVGNIDTDCSSDCARFTFIPSSSGVNVALLNNTWTNPATGNGSAGAVTYINSATGLAGPISSANSIIGVGQGDEIGSGGIFTLGITGNFIVASPAAANGALGGAGLVHIVTPGSGGSTTAPATGQTFSATPGSDVTITPASIVAITNTGTALVLQANNDITLNPSSDIVTSAGGAGGAVTLQAGRSVVLNSSITTDNGAMTIVANERTANGVIDANRDPGVATITMAAGKTINAGTGNISLTLNDGAGLTNSTSGNIVLASLTTSGIVSVQNIGPTAGSGIVASDPSQIVTAGSAAFDVNGAGGGGGIGTGAAPINVAVGSIAARAGTGGDFFDSPALGLTIGSVGGLTGISAAGAGNIQLATAGPISIGQNVSSGSGAITLTAGSTLTEAGGTISTAGALTTTSANGTTLGGANAVGTLNATNTTSGNVVFANAQALTVTGVSEAGGGNVTLTTSAGAMTLAGQVNAGTGTVTLTSAGDLTGGGPVAGASVVLSATNGAIGSPTVGIEVVTPALSASAANGITLDINGLAPQLVTVNQMQNTATGDILLNAHGGATFSALVSDPGGSVTINTFSPLDLNGITAGNSIFLSTGGGNGSGSVNDMTLVGAPTSYTYNMTSGTFNVTIGRGGQLTLPTGTTPIVLTAELFPNPVNIKVFDFIPTDPLGNPDVAAAYNTTLLSPLPSPKFDLGDPKKDQQDKQKKGIAACK